MMATMMVLMVLMMLLDVTKGKKNNERQQC